LLVGDQFEALAEHRMVRPRCAEAGILSSVLTERDLQPATQTALAALRGIRPLVQQRRGAADVTEKSPNDIVTATDVLVQNTMEQLLRQHEPDIAFVGEEGTSKSSGQTRRMWLVDPICGTPNYAAALPLFATNIALVEEGQVVAGCVADGGTGELCVAESGLGAYLVEAGGLRRLRVDAGYGLVSIDPNIAASGGLGDFSTAFAIRVLEQRRWGIRALASTIALQYVATGRLAGAVYGWDGLALHVAAGALLAKEAGARVTDHTGADWTVDSPILVVAATDGLHAELQPLAAQVYREVTE
jgi:myo-inositol-1(or 4)-monophosphatase